MPVVPPHVASVRRFEYTGSGKSGIGRVYVELVVDDAETRKLPGYEQANGLEKPLAGLARYGVSAVSHDLYEGDGRWPHRREGDKDVYVLDERVSSHVWKALRDTGRPEAGAWFAVRVTDHFGRALEDLWLQVKDQNFRPDLNPALRDVT